MAIEDLAAGTRRAEGEPFEAFLVRIFETLEWRLAYGRDPGSGDQQRAAHAHILASHPDIASAEYVAVVEARSKALYANEIDTWRKRFEDAKAEREQYEREDTRAVAELWKLFLASHGRKTIRREDLSRILRLADGGDPE